MRRLHYGEYVKNDKPVTGVFPLNSLDINGDAQKGFNPDWVKHLRQCPHDDHEECDWDDSLVFIGYTMDTEGNPQKNMRSDYCAIIDYATDEVNVTYSRWAIHAPLHENKEYAGKVDARKWPESADQVFTGYAVPPDRVSRHAANLSGRIVPLTHLTNLKSKSD